MDDNENDVYILQKLARKYLHRVSVLADKYNLKNWVQQMLKSNIKGECIASKDDVELLAKIVEDDCIKVKDIPKLLGVSYRHIVDNNIKFKKLEDRGHISKVDVLLIKERLKDKLKK